MSATKLKIKNGAFIGTDTQDNQVPTMLTATQQAASIATQAATAVVNSTAENIAPAYDDTKAYTPGEVVSKDGEVYKCITSTKTVTPHASNITVVPQDIQDYYNGTGSVTFTDANPGWTTYRDTDVGVLYGTWIATATVSLGVYSDEIIRAVTVTGYDDSQGLVRTTNRTYSFNNYNHKLTVSCVYYSANDDGIEVQGLVLECTFRYKSQFPSQTVFTYTKNILDIKTLDDIYIDDLSAEWGDDSNKWLNNNIDSSTATLSVSGTYLGDLFSLSTVVTIPYTYTTTALGPEPWTPTHWQQTDVVELVDNELPHLYEHAVTITPPGSTVSYCLILLLDNNTEFNTSGQVIGNLAKFRNSHGYSSGSDVSIIQSTTGYSGTKLSFITASGTSGYIEVNGSTVSDDIRTIF